MLGAETVAKRSKAGTKIYYSIAEKKVFDSPGLARWYVTELLRPNTAEEIEQAVRRWLAM